MRALMITAVVMWVCIPIAAVSDAYRTFFRVRELRTSVSLAGIACLGVALLIYAALLPAAYSANIELLFIIGVAGFVLGILATVIGMATEREMRKRMICSAVILMVWIPLTAFAALPSS